MVRHGKAPFLECSSKGDMRFSAFYARIKSRNNRTIEELYQASKVFEDGVTNLSIKDAKGRKAINQEECSLFYSKLWDEYIDENKELLKDLLEADGLSDVFGAKGSVCQATELWRIRNEAKQVSQVTVKARECKFVVHIPALRNVRPDLHYIKETLHMSDGSLKDNIRMIENFERPYYITMPRYRNHKQKKEYELIDRVQQFKSTQTDLANNIAGKLGKVGYRKNKMRDVVDSPYLYGVEISSEALIKKAYMDKYPNAQSEFKVAAYDIEYDVDTKEISVISVVMEDKLYTVINKKFVNGIKDPEGKVKELYRKHIPKSDIKKSVKYIKVEVANDEVAVIRKSFEVANKWSPDFLAIWNINSDIPHILKRLKKYDIKPEDIICDQDIPKERRLFYWKEGPKKKLTDSGKETGIDWEKQWHYAFSTTRFVMVDAACVYSQVRVGQQTVPGGYGLENILNTELELGKLKFYDDEVKLENADWHRYMSKNRFLEYSVYNQWDVMSMIELDNKILDMRLSMPLLAGPSSFAIFNSMPKKIVDDLHFFYMDRGRVLGCKPSRLREEYKLLGMERWIITLPASLQITEKMHHIMYDDLIETQMTTHDYDVD